MMPLGLLRKELRQVLPWALAILTVEMATEVLIFTTTTPDSLAWAHRAPIFEGGGFRSVTLMVWALVLAYAGFPREHDDETLPFLLALPVRRSMLFLAKAGVAAMVLLAAVLVTEVLRWLAQLPNPTSFGGHTFRLDWALVCVGLSSAFALIALGYALFLSVLRRFGLLLAPIVWTFLEVIEQQTPALKRLNPLELLEVEFDGTEALVPWTALLGHAAAAAALSAVAAYVWVGPIERWATAVARWVTHTSARILLVLGIVGLLGAAAFMYRGYASDESAKFGTLAELDAAEAELSSRRYRFRYPSPLRQRVERLAASADGLHDQLVVRLGARAGSSIEVNMMRTSAFHAGSATWNSIRLDLSHAYDDRELQRTLVHETAHVLALRVSDRRIVDHNLTLRLFDEGLAEHFAYRLVPDAAKVEARWLEATLAKERFRINEADLFALDNFRARFAEMLLYPVGYTWLEALTSLCGDDTPARVLRALSDPKAPKDLAGQALWRNTLTAVRCDANQVALRWEELLTKKAGELRDDIARVPVIAGGINRTDDDAIVLRAEIEGTKLEASSYQVNTRASADAPPSEYMAFSGEEQSDGSIEFVVWTGAVDGEMLEFQFVQSWLREGALVTHAEKWQRSRIPPANNNAP
jgi:hypothetical protein